MNKKNKIQMHKYLTELLEENSDFKIIESSNEGIYIYDKKLESNIAIALYNGKRTNREFQNMVGEFRRNNVPLLNIFYKDGKNFFVRLAEKQALRQDKSFKRYPGNVINKMVHMRDLEKEVFKMNGDPMLYYQPKTERNHECLRLFKFGEVYLDYEHISNEDKRAHHIQSKYSKIYKITMEDDVIIDGKEIKFFYKDGYAKNKASIEKISLQSELKIIPQKNSSTIRI